MKKHWKKYIPARGTKKLITVEHVRDIPNGFEPVVELMSSKPDRQRLYTGVNQNFVDGYLIRGRVFAHTMQALAWVAERRAAHEAAVKAMESTPVATEAKPKEVDFSNLAGLMGQMVTAQHRTNRLLGDLLLAYGVTVVPETVEKDIPGQQHLAFDIPHEAHA
jgi:hypothetical protein